MNAGGEHTKYTITRTATSKSKQPENVTEPSNSDDGLFIWLFFSFFFF